MKSVLSSFQWVPPMVIPELPGLIPEVTPGPYTRFKLAWHQRFTVRPNQQPRFVRSLRCLEKQRRKNLQLKEQMLDQQWAA